MIAMIILVLAWSLSAVTEVLNTAGYLVSVLGDALHPGFVPALVFILSAATAFATGSSWGTMGILMPLVLPLCWAVMQASKYGDARELRHHLLNRCLCTRWFGVGRSLLANLRHHDPVVDGQWL